MPIDFTPDPRAADLAARTAEFVRRDVLPLEPGPDAAWDGGVPPELRARLHGLARAAGVFAPHLPARWGGLGLDLRGQALVFEQAGYSLLGPVALNCSAPDEGNMHLLEAVGSEAQRQRYLAPLARGETRSAFAMTEPAPGAGSDPTLVRTTAARTSGGWTLNGTKWFITGARGAAFLICMARTSGEPGDRGGATMFLVDADTPGLRIVRDIPTLESSMSPGHSEVRLEDVFVDDDAVLGEVDRGFEYAQVRLGPARLTHCMRWLGVAARAQEIAIGHARRRQAFGSPLAELGLVQGMIADSEIDLAASRSLALRAAWALDCGDRAAMETSIAKTFVAEAVGRIVDRAVQTCGALGVSTDTPLATFYREVRSFRIYDGPSETHRWAIARRAVRAAARTEAASTPPSADERMNDSTETSA